MIGRRGFITGLISLVAAPAIVRVASIMPVKVMMPFEFSDSRIYMIPVTQSFPDEWKTGLRLTMAQWIELTEREIFDNLIVKTTA